jgi:hypothetical protein
VRFADVASPVSGNTNATGFDELLASVPFWKRRHGLLGGLGTFGCLSRLPAVPHAKQQHEKQPARCRGRQQQVNEGPSGGDGQNDDFR